MEDRTKGSLFILLSALFFALMAATVKNMNNIPVPEMIFFRNLIGLIVAIYLIKKKRRPVWGKNKKFLILRSVFGLTGVAAFFYALSKINLTDAVILNKMSPFFVAVLSAIFLHEKLNKKQSVSLILALIGATLVIKPRFDYTILPSLIGLLGALLGGSAYTVIRHLRYTDYPETIVFYFTLISTVTMIPFLVWGKFVIPTSLNWLALLGLGVFATVAQFLMTNAYRYAPAGELAIYTYSNIIFSSLIGLFFWFEVPDIYSIIGAVAIIIAGFMNYFARQHKKLVKNVSG